VDLLHAKLSDFAMPDARAEDDVSAFLDRINDTSTAYPRTRTVPELFSERAAAVPNAVAVAYGTTRLSYRELDERSNRLARYLGETGTPHEAPVGVMLERSPEQVVALLGVLKAGAAYLPINPEYPYERIRNLLRDTATSVLIGGRAQIGELNKLQWECPDLRLIICPDTDDIHTEIEPASAFGDLDMWEHVATEAFDDISAGGWKSSYTGEWLSREVMDGYGENIRAKLAPLLRPDARILEIGCASGISMFRLAPLVAYYHGTDISPGIAQWAERERRRRGLDNVRIECLAAHDVDRVVERDFDVVIINSVIECFNGHNYLRDVLAKAIALLRDRGILFLGNLWDQDTKDAFVDSLRRFHEAHPDSGYRTKLDREEELYVARAFLQDLRFDLPAIRDIEFSSMLGEAESELSRFGYDAIVHIDKQAKALPAEPRHRRQADRRAIAAMSPAALPSVSTPRSLAYLIQTSGSAGLPKCVMVEHRAIVRLVRDTDYIDLRGDDRLLATGSLAFDASTFEIWGPLLNGASVCLPRGGSVADPAVLSTAMRDHAATTVFLTTALFNHLAEIDPAFFAGLSTVLTGGEKVSVRHVNLVRRACPALRLLHVYGPTETTTFATWYPVEGVHESDVPIGHPIANATAYILDEELRPLQPGLAGQLYIGGDGLARGYFADPALTACKFIPHPRIAGARLYRTGDLARFSPAGEIEFLGRADRQVKIRGYRVEPEEVERCLGQHRAVRQFAIQCTGEGDDRALVAYVAGSGQLTPADLQHDLERQLPHFMLPAHIVVLPELPLNASGKVDRAALPLPEAAVRERPKTPQREIQIPEELAGIWMEVLGVNHADAADSFFELGGHSLKVPRLVSLIRTRMGVELPYVAVYTAETLGELSDYLADRQRLAEQGIDPRLTEETMVLLRRPEPGGRSVFAFPPGSGYGLAYGSLTRLIGPHGLYAFSFIERATRCEEYAELIAGVEPDEPCTLFGFSGGGKLAFEVAAHLEQSGRSVRAVVMVDAARYLRPVTFTEADTRAIAAEFLDGVTSAVLRDKAYRKMVAYRDHLGRRVETEVLSADLHVVTEVDSPGVFRAPDGSVIATIDGWRELTRGRFSLQTGAGGHRAMLDPEYVPANARLLRGIFDADAEVAAGDRGGSAR
jgi:amino acid adenylation domain-containing protein